MSTITFRGAFIRYADLRNNESGWFMRLHFTAGFSKPVAEAMGWDEVIPDCVDSGKLDGALIARNLVLMPTDKLLKDQEIQMEATEVSDFQFMRVTEGDSRRSELRFIVRVSQVGAIAHVENYLRLVGQAPAALKIGYEEQQQLELGEKAEAVEA